jgi:hypothetical protein
LASLPPTWTVLDDLAWPGRQFSNIDHVVVGPQGVFVIDTQDWSGHVSVERRGLHQGGRDRTTSVWGAAAAAASVPGLVASVRTDHVHPVVVVAGGDLDTSQVDGVMVCATDQLVTALTSHQEVLPGGVTKAVAADVARRLRPNNEPSPTWALPVAEPTGHRGRRRRPWSGLLVALVFGLLGAATVVTYPEALTSVADQVADLFVG